MHTFTHLREPSVRFARSLEPVYEKRGLMTLYVYHMPDESERIGHLAREDDVYVDYWRYQRFHSLNLLI